MKFLVCNFILLIGYFAFIENNEVINDFKKVKAENLQTQNKLTCDNYNKNKVSVSDHIDNDVKQLHNYRK